MGTDLLGTDRQRRRDQIGRHPRAPTATSGTKVPHALTSVPGVSSRARQLHLRRRRVGASGTTRSRTSSKAAGAARRRTSSSSSPPRRRIRSRTCFTATKRRTTRTSLRRLFLPQVERAVDVALSLQPRDQERVGDGDPGGPGDRQVHLRLHGDRRGLEVRAQLGLPARGRDHSLEVRQGRQRRAGRLVLEPYPLQGVLQHLHGAAAAPAIARTPRATPRPAPSSTCSTPARSSGRTRSRIR